MPPIFFACIEQALEESDTTMAEFSKAILERLADEIVTAVKSDHRFDDAIESLKDHVFSALGLEHESEPGPTAAVADASSPSASPAALPGSSADFPAPAPWVPAGTDG